jgi:hypothetical protein
MINGYILSSHTFLQDIRNIENISLKPVNNILTHIYYFIYVILLNRKVSISKMLPQTVNRNYQ